MCPWYPKLVWKSNLLHYSVQMLLFSESLKPRSNTLLVWKPDLLHCTDIACLKAWCYIVQILLVWKSDLLHCTNITCLKSRCYSVQISLVWRDNFPYCSIKYIHCDPSLEPSCRNSCNEGSQYMFLLKIRKNYLWIIITTPSYLELWLGPAQAKKQASNKKKTHYKGWKIE